MMWYIHDSDDSHEELGNSKVKFSLTALGIPIQCHPNLTTLAPLFFLQILLNCPYKSFKFQEDPKERSRNLYFPFFDALQSSSNLHRTLFVKYFEI